MFIANHFPELQNTVRYDLTAILEALSTLQGRTPTGWRGAGVHSIKFIIKYASDKTLNHVYSVPGFILDKICQFTKFSVPILHNYFSPILDK